MDSSYFWENGGIRLRALRLSDWEKHYESRFDTEARRLLEYQIELPPCETEDKHMCERFAGFNQADGRIVFAIETLEQVVIGGVNLNSIDERNGTFSIGIQIYPEERGKGYGYLAFDKLLEYAFLERRLNKWNSACIETNTASIALHKKCGCVEEGKRREVIYTQGKYYDEILFGLTVGEYIKNKEEHR